VVRLERVGKRYPTRHGEVRALDEVSFHVDEGEFAVVRGPSGSGKTTLLLTVGGMLRPTRGKVIAAGSDVFAMGARERAVFRAGNIGFVFQMYYLVPYLNVVENVLLSAGVGKSQAERKEARALLKRLNLSDREAHKPAELSAGERQRTAIARALLNRPKIILADEPTGNLDRENAGEVNRYLAAFCGEGGTVIMATHGSLADEHADRIIDLREGRVEESPES